MTTKPFQVLAALLATFGLMAGANAASIFLVPGSISDVVTGDVISFDVVMDFSTDTNGLGSDITLGGGFDIVYDASALAFVGLQNAMLGDPAFGRDPDVFSGLLESWGFADFNGLTGPALVGSVQFQVLAGMGSSTFVGTAATNGIAGPFVSGIDFITLLNVDYQGADVNRVVPVPAAIWFMLSGLGALIGMRKK